MFSNMQCSSDEQSFNLSSTLFSFSLPSFVARPLVPSSLPSSSAVVQDDADGVAVKVAEEEEGMTEIERRRRAREAEKRQRCSLSSNPNLVDVPDIFYFFCSGEGSLGEPEAPEGGVGAIFNGKSQEGGLLGEWGRGGEGP